MLVVVGSFGGVVFLDLVAVRRVCSSEDRRRWKGLLVDGCGVVGMDEVEISRVASGFGRPGDGRIRVMGLKTVVAMY